MSRAAYERGSKLIRRSLDEEAASSKGWSYAAMAISHNSDLRDEIEKLKAKVIQLEAELEASKQQTLSAETSREHYASLWHNNIEAHDKWMKASAIVKANFPTRESYLRAHLEAEIAYPHLNWNMRAAAELARMEGER